MPAIKTNNTQLYYEIHGKGQPLVLITGFNSNLSVWANVVQDYARHYQVITIDNRGCGQSAAPDVPYTIDMMTDDIVSLCDALKLDKAHFLGLSMGGMVVQSIAHRYPQRVLSIVLNNSMIQIDIRFALFAKGRLKLMQLGMTPQTELQISLGWAFSSEFLKQPGIIDAAIASLNDYPYPMTETGYRHQLHALLEFNSESWISKIKVPCLVIGSDEDMISSEAHMHSMAERIPQAQYYCFKGAGHIPHVEQPEKFVELTHQFFQKHSTPTMKHHQNCC